LREVVYAVAFRHGQWLPMRRLFTSSDRRSLQWAAGLLCGCALLGECGCPAPAPPPSAPVYNNTTDPTNGGATYLGSAACEACHPDVAAKQALHGHAHILNRILGQPLTFPAQATRAIVPNPPAGYAWGDTAYVIGGYVRKAKFIDQTGFIAVAGIASPLTQWDLSFPPNGTLPGFVLYEPATTAAGKAYDYSCFVCHTTGPKPQEASNPRFQENRPGFIGTWQEAGVQCESCHGPGSNHPPNTAARMMYVNVSARACGTCHSRPFASGGGVILAADGFIQHHEQYAELLASPGHSGFNCVTCHDPHTGTNYDLANAFSQTCATCHPNMNMALHEGKVYARGDYGETLTCTSCHMPFATKSATSTIIGQSAGRVGDMRTHIFRINTAPVGYEAMFTADLSQVVKDADGKAAVTLDFVCLRCHNTDNGYPFRLTLSQASDAAPGLHGFP
jgi:hypothetical protein